MHILEATGETPSDIDPVVTVDAHAVRYEGIPVEFQTEQPTEFDPAAYAILDVGGPDPNGQGLFGYDNTPGKDIGNLRLHDHVGGANAQGAEDGYGYGGVFIESFLYFSEHPPFTGDPPPSSPLPASMVW